jgi:hypothetical protein
MNLGTHQGVPPVWTGTWPTSGRFVLSRQKFSLSVSDTNRLLAVARPAAAMSSLAGAGGSGSARAVTDVSRHGKLGGETMSQRVDLVDLTSGSPGRVMTRSRSLAGHLNPTNPSPGVFGKTILHRSNTPFMLSL